jgi:hypothetical protein
MSGMNPSFLLTGLQKAKGSDAGIAVEGRHIVGLLVGTILERKKRIDYATG